MQTKLSHLLDLMASGDWSAALRFAAKFPRLGDHRDDILRAKDALLQPESRVRAGCHPNLASSRDDPAAILRVG